MAFITMVVDGFIHFEVKVEHNLFRYIEKESKALFWKFGSLQMNIDNGRINKDQLAVFSKTYESGLLGPEGKSKTREQV